MPYIPPYRREDLETLDPHSAGELNYKITQTLLQYLKAQGTSYDSLNEIVGVLECAKLEFYRRAVVAYEDEKIKENGDVY